jgi:hypothetical protein
VEVIKVMEVWSGETSRWFRDIPDWRHQVNGFFGMVDKESWRLKKENQSWEEGRFELEELPEDSGTLLPQGEAEPASSNGEGKRVRIRPQEMKKAERNQRRRQRKPGLHRKMNPRMERKRRSQSNQRKKKKSLKIPLWTDLHRKDNKVHP